MPSHQSSLVFLGFDLHLFVLMDEMFQDIMRRALIGDQQDVFNYITKRAGSSLRLLCKYEALLSIMKKKLEKDIKAADSLYRVTKTWIPETSLGGIAVTHDNHRLQLASIVNFIVLAAAQKFCKNEEDVADIPTFLAIWIATFQSIYSSELVRDETDFCKNWQALKIRKEAIIQSLEQKIETARSDDCDQLQRILHAWRAITDEKYVKAFLTATESFFKGMSVEDVKKSNKDYTGDKYSSMYTVAGDLAKYLEGQLSKTQSNERIISACKSADPTDPRENIRVVLPVEFVEKLRMYLLDMSKTVTIVTCFM